VRGSQMCVGAAKSSGRGRSTHTMDPCPSQSWTGSDAHSLSSVHRHLDNPLSDQQPPVNNAPMSRRGERTVLNERVAVGWLTNPVAATVRCNRNAFLAPWRNTRLASSVSPSLRRHTCSHTHTPRTSHLHDPRLRRAPPVSPPRCAPHWLAAPLSVHAHGTPSTRAVERPEPTSRNTTLTSSPCPRALFGR
jgi:hypothetical protein